MTGQALDPWTRATIVLLVFEVILLAALPVLASSRHRGDRAAVEANRALARTLQLTDLALAPGTSYSRHPSQADLFAAHGDHPAAIEHFPAGSVIQPPDRPPRGRPRSLGGPQP